MNNIVLKQCEENLLKRRHEILPFLQHLAEESGDAAENHFARSESGGEREAFLAGRLAAVYQRELDDIETALSRIRKGTFGHCHACHQPIEPSRLERFPRAEFCLRCKAM